MKILFLVRHYTYLRNFESAVGELARRGHQVHISADRWELLGGEKLVERLAAEHPGRITYGWTPGRESGAWFELARRLRLGLDYLRFVDARYDATPHLRARARARAPRILLRAMRLPWLQGPAGTARVERFLRLLEQGIPRAGRLEAFLLAQDPDAVLITPLIELGTPQLDHLIAARAAGRRSALAVGSWDHLSSKSRLRELPDMVMVWNPIQKDEAVQLHGIPADRVVVTGAQCFDQWFDRRPSRPRDEFLERVGLPGDRPFLLYVCSSLFRGTGHEPRFVERWIQAVRASTDPRVRDAAILVRPHPQRLEEWAGTDLSGYRDVVLYGAHPIDAESKNDYFDSMYYSAAVVGLNTSAFIEAACVGRPVYTVLLPEFSDRNQEGTIHFRYLMEVNGGLLHAARSLEDHLAQLGEALGGAGSLSAKSRRFAEGFVRPFGLDEPATPRFADAVETLARQPAPAPVRASAARAWLARALMAPWIAVVSLQVSTELARKSTRTFIARTKRKTLEHAWAPVRTWLLRKLGAAPPPARTSTVLPKIGKGADPAKLAKFPNVPEAQEVRELITALGRTDLPIVAGPWLTETGFELLYWIPFLTWARAYGNFDPERLIIISRGGAAPWYRRLTTKYADAFTFYTPDEFRTRNEERLRQQGGRFKHVEVSAFDRDIIARATGSLKLGKIKLLHPSVMYRLFNGYWRQLAPVTLVDAFAAFDLLPPMDRGAIAGQLPAEYVAVKFYANGALPDSPENRAFIRRTLTELTRTSDVVLLNTGVRFDDHADYAPDVRERVHTIDRLMRPENNLAVQSQVIAGARAFVGTYGGFSYLAPLLGVDTLAFYSNPTGFRFDHLDLARRVFAHLQGGAFVPMDLREVDVVRLGLGAVGEPVAALKK